MIVTETVEAYLQWTRIAPDSVLAEMEAQGRREGIPIVVPETAALLHVLARSCAARRIVEVGTAIGVSTLHLARALPEDGTILSFEIDEARQRRARAYLERAGMAGRADLRLQDAAEGLAELEPGSYDLVFLDGLKDDYATHLALAIPLLRAGGMLVADNTLLDGAVAAGRPAGHWTQQHVDQMREFNRQVIEDPRLAAALVPIGDGVIVAVVV